MQNHFKVAGDFDPTKQEEIHLDMIEIKEREREEERIVERKKERKKTKQQTVRIP